MAFTNNYKYVDSAGLGEFLTQLKAKYAANTASSYTVNHSLESDKLATARTISLTGDATGSVSFDGSANASITVAIADVVASTSGAGGTHGLMIATDKEKLNGIEAGAQVNVVDTIEVWYGDTPAKEEIVTMDGKTAKINLNAYAKKADITAVLRFKGIKDYQSELPTSGNKVGDVWFVRYKGTSGTEPLNAEFVWTEATGTGAWEMLGSAIDLSNYYTKSETDTKLDAIFKKAGTGTAEDPYVYSGLAAEYTNRVYNEITVAGTTVRSGLAKDYVDNSIAALDVASAKTGSQYYVVDVIETDGKISQTYEEKGTVASGITKLVDGGTVYTAISDAVNALDATVSQASSSTNGLALQVVEADGKLTSVSGSIVTAAQSDIDGLFA